MEFIFFDSLIKNPKGKLYIPDGIGPFPSVIILKQGEEKDDSPSIELYAKKMNEIGFLAFALPLLTGEQIENLHSHLNSTVDYLTSREEVDAKKIFLLIADRENKIEIQLACFHDRIQALASLNWLN